VLADGKVLLDTVVGPNSAKNGWLDVSVDLTEYAGKSVKLELQNKANDWAYEAGYWAKIVLVSK
jgi:bacillopeptidase F (M6 metalloprotease family)